MDETQLLRDIAGLGVGGILAVLVLIWKRADDQRYQASLSDLITRVMSGLEGHTKALEKITAAIDALCTLQKVEDRLQALEGKLNDKLKEKEA